MAGHPLWCPAVSVYLERNIVVEKRGFVPSVPVTGSHDGSVPAGSIPVGAEDIEPYEGMAVPYEGHLDAVLAASFVKD